MSFNIHTVSDRQALCSCQSQNICSNFRLYYYPRVMGLEEQKICVDPAYQLEKNPESTFYPKGTICFKDPSASK